MSYIMLFQSFANGSKTSELIVVFEVEITDLIFCFSADHLSSDLILQHVSVESLHGNREQCDRERALENFKTGTFIQLVFAA